MQYEELLKAFGESLGLGDFPQEHGPVAIDVDGMPIAFVHKPETDRIVLLGTVGEPPPEAAGRFGALLLQANFMFEASESCTLAQNPEGGTYVLQRELPLEFLDVGKLQSTLEGFANTLERWRRALLDFRPLEESAGTVSAGEPAPPRFGGDGFIAV
ncbi:MAG: type III secretion system chaperone [Kiritimatiellae bacterium]|nr:type III secretion system chaperone [Kiritimatiellia bacterium]